MDINNPQDFDHILERSGLTLKLAVYPIGAWNMDVTVSVSVTTDAIPTEDIVALGATIHDDSLNQAKDLDYAYTNIPSGQVGYTESGPRVDLTRITGGAFDNANHNDAVMNRGYVYIWYLE